MKKCVFSFLLTLLVLQYAAAQQPEIIKDINPGSAGSYIIYLTPLGNKAVFKATNQGYSNNEPWVTDGTAEGTFMLKEIDPSTVSGSSIFNVVSYKNEILFSANDATNGSELWKTDGTTEGTIMVRDISPGNTSSQPGGLTPFKDAIYFSAYHPASGTELWKTEGTEESTVLVSDITSGEASTKPGYLYATDNFLYFTGLDNHYLYRSDGTANGTTMLSDQVLIAQLENAFFTKYMNEIYFRGTDLPGTIDGKGSQLWKITSEDNIQRVTGIVTGDNTTVLDPLHLTVAGDKLFFIGEEYPYGRELWAYDGTTAYMVKDINSSGNGNLGGDFFIGFRGTLFFSAGDADSGIELWKSDGTAAGTQIIEMVPGPAGSSVTSPVQIGDTLFFSAYDGTGGELWMLTSPESQPVKFTDIPNGGAWGPELVKLNNNYIFPASDATNGTELWKKEIQGTTDILQAFCVSPEIKIHPNPARDMFLVEIPEEYPLPVIITIYNSEGSILFREEVSTRSLKIDRRIIKITPGLYILMVSSQGKKASARVIISE